MSVEATTWAWRQTSKLSSGARLVLLAIADHAARHDDPDLPDGLVAWPKIARLATMTGLSDSTVRDHIATLVEVGLVEKVERKVDRRTHRAGPNILRLVVESRPPTDGRSKTADRPAAQTADPPAVYSSTPEPLEGTQTLDLAESEPDEPTTMDVARLTAIAFYDHIKADTGKPPVGWSVPQMMKLVKPFYDVGWTVAEVKRALLALDARGAPFTRPTIERELRGNGRRPGTVNATTRSQDALAEWAAERGVSTSR